MIQTVQPWAQSPKEASREGLDTLPHLMEYSTGALANNNKKYVSDVFCESTRYVHKKKNLKEKKMLPTKTSFF